jgi:hypothetical protein
MVLTMYLMFMTMVKKLRASASPVPLSQTLLRRVVRMEPFSGPCHTRLGLYIPAPQLHRYIKLITVNNVRHPLPFPDALLPWPPLSLSDFSLSR